MTGFDGHTSYLQRQTNANYSIMLMRNKDFAIVVGTQHIPLREVARIFTQAYFEQLVHQTLDAFIRHFRQPAPRLAILGINPHAGEIDPEAEEKKWMQTSIQKLQAQGIQIQGPFPADSFFAKARHQNWDAIISPYHDQALIAAKYNGLADVVNITLGLPF
ncbi:MAG: 4-hydroxythreonine-4-phosphate dehydrogenase PdxA [Bdellovibrionota bacterium]